MKNIFFSLLRRRKKRSEKKRLNKNISMFLSCLLVSCLCWCMIKLGKEYQYKVYYKIDYLNLPENKAVLNQLEDSVCLDVNADGFFFFKHKLFKTNAKLFLDCQWLKQTRDSIYYLTSKEQTDIIEKQLKNAVSVNKIIPDTFYFNFSSKFKKRVPVKLKLTTSFDKQYQLADSILYSPSTLEIYGPKIILDKINYVTTQDVNLLNLTKTVNQKVPVNKTYKILGYSSDSINLTVPVDKFTEGITEVPLILQNVPKGYMLRLFPDKIKIKYHIGISNLEKVNSSSFKAVVNYNHANTGSNPKLPVEIVSYPSFVSFPKPSPEKVEYIIHK